MARNTAEVAKGRNHNPPLWIYLPHWKLSSAEPCPQTPWSRHQHMLQSPACICQKFILPMTIPLSTWMYDETKMRRNRVDKSRGPTPSFDLSILHIRPPMPVGNLSGAMLHEAQSLLGQIILIQSVLHYFHQSLGFYQHKGKKCSWFHKTVAD